MNEPGYEDLEELRRVAYRIAGEAAAYLRDLACSDESLAKSLGGETVLADAIAEDYIISALHEELGQVRVVTEEKGVVGKGDITAVVDPLDGSKNYLNCIPWASVSIAFAPTGGTLNDVLAGAVAPIFYGDIISFARGGGCRIGHYRIREKGEPQKYVFVYIDHPEAAELVARTIALLGGGYKVRSLGSAALELAYTGLRRATMFLDLRSKLRNVDVAAAFGIIRECGGFVRVIEGREQDISIDRVVRVGNILATPTPDVYKKLDNLFRKIFTS
ncbi:MAG: hypothetical protein F7C35_02710 [Desulfurococcales archaeon]|nr:hypothetical protein [Desulfurococcales archaeon]